MIQQQLLEEFKGTARIRAVTKNGSNYRYYLSDVTMTAGNSFRNTQSIGIDSDRWGNLVLENSKAVLKETADNDLLFPLPTIRPQALTDISLEVQRRFTGTATGGAVTITLSATGETFTNTSDWIVIVDSSGAVQPATFGAVGTQSMAISGLATGASTILAKVNKSAGVIRTKTLTETTVTTTIDSDGAGLAYLDLGKADIYDVSRIRAVDSDGIDLTSVFTVDDGQRDNSYTPGRLLVNGNQTPPSGNVFVRFNYLLHGAAGDFFAVNSYTGQVEYKNIPSHTLNDGTTIQLRDVLDFRPRKDDTNANFSAATARVNELPSPSNLITADVNYYLGRKDKLVLYPPIGRDLNSALSIIEGTASTQPQYPATPDEALELYRIDLNPFTLNDSDLSANIIKAKRYTMADIGRIDRKVDNLAEITSLSLLELDTNNLSILDSAGVNRLKSGFLVDNFSNHSYSDTKAIDYRASINLLTKSLYPSFREDNVRLLYDSDLSTNTVKKGDNVYINYTEQTQISQSQASGTQNVNPFSIPSFHNEITLSPSTDEWKDPIESVPAVPGPSVVSSYQPYNYDNNQISWQAITDGQYESIMNTGSAYGVPGGATLEEKGVRTVIEPGGITKYRITDAVEESVKTVINNRVLNTTITPFMRSRRVYFKVAGLIPNSRYFAFFDGVSVANWVREETSFVRISDDTTDYGNKYENATGHPDTATNLFADVNGILEGSFFIPNTSVIRFKTGVREFALMDISVYDKNKANSIATALYTSAGAIDTQQQSVYNTKPLIKTPGYYDPIAQSFKVLSDVGFFVTKLRLYFASKDAILPVKVSLRPMVNGHPSSYDTIPGSLVHKIPSEVNIVSTQTVAGVLAAGTDFEFDEPIYLLPNTEYAICISTESLDYSVYVSEMLKFELGSTEKRITKQYGTGSLFLSQNGTTWEATRTKDVTFQLYRANFDTAGGTAITENIALPVDQLSLNPLDLDSGDATITVYHPGHGYDTNEKVILSGLTGATTYGGILGSSLMGQRTITGVDYDHYTFEADSDATANTVIGDTLISATRNIQFDTAVPYIENIIPTNTNISISGKFTTGSSLAGSETRFQKDTSYTPLTFNDKKIFESPRIIGNQHSEDSDLGGDKSLTIQVPMTTTSNLVSPVLDMSRASLSLVSHRIDKQDSASTSGFNVPINWAAETVSKNGSNLAKHITTPIMLAQDAVGLKILLSANRPSVADFLVYYRIAEDGQFLKDVSWTLVDKENAVISDENPNVFREYRYLVGGDGGDINPFTEFQLKIVMRSTNSAKIPVIKNLRAIALAV
jgi:hypothetical protein